MSGATQATAAHTLTAENRIRDERALVRSLRPFEEKSAATAFFQVASTLGLYVVAVGLMYAGLLQVYWIALLLTLVAGAAVVRIFTLQHDCGHGSFLRSTTANTWVGRLCSLFTYTPYRHWARQHAGHHANWNNLDRRESGVDIYSHCLTVDEYQALPRGQRLAYRLRRNPILLFGLLPPLIFTLLYRVPFDTPSDWQAERRSVWLTNAALLLLWTLQVWAFGWLNVLLVQGLVIVVASAMGTWLFFVQHQFEHTAWMRKGEWSYTDAALRGSSHLQLPGLLRWVTGNIGLHPLHHLNPRIPNYQLRNAEKGSDVLAETPRLTIRGGFRATAMALWDESAGRMVSFASLRS
jgi:acyl-lipid omega-6 desaturase (Delta-12 desaturase)